MLSLAWAVLIWLAVGACAVGQDVEVRGRAEREAGALRSVVDESPALALRAVALRAKITGGGAVSGVAVGGDGTIYEIRRVERGDAVLALDESGSVRRGWGGGLYKVAHSVRTDPQGNVWTVDAEASVVTKFSAMGKMLLTIAVGGQPENGSRFRGATDIAFGPDGRIYVTDGYGNARVLEYTATGKLVRQWGSPGSGPGAFDLPHAIQISRGGTIYVADRENDRIERFNRNGRYLGEFAHLGRVYSLKLSGAVLWVSVGPPDLAPGAAGGWILKLDAASGKVLGHVAVPGEGGGHAIDVMPDGLPIVTSGEELLRFEAVAADR